MKSRQVYHQRLTAIIVSFSFLLTAVSYAPAAHSNSSSSRSSNGSVLNERLATVVNATGASPAPVFDPEMRRMELAQRRARVAEKIGPDGVLVLFSGEPRVYTGDVDYEYRQENNLYYLTDLKQQGATLVLMPGNTGVREVLFLPRLNPAQETWNGRMYSAAQAQSISGISEIWDANRFAAFMRALRRREAFQLTGDAALLSSSAAAAPQAATGYEGLFKAMTEGRASLFLLIPNEKENREFRQEQRFAAEWAQSATGFNVRNAWPIFNELRLRKSPTEMQLLQHAIDITVEAFTRAMGAAGRAQWEYEVEAEVEYTFKRRNADYWGYPSIVGCGHNATTLHYVESQGQVKQGTLLLMDVGAEYGHYTADITRTFPINGKFSPVQAEIYNVVLAAQEAGMHAIRPGATIADVHNAAREVIKDGLLRLGLITDRNSDQYRTWFMHGTSHWLGMNVHDVGARDAKFEPNMVFTVEPGIYVREDALDHLPKTPENERFAAAVRPAFEKYKHIGVRIEDDVVVTGNGYNHLSAALPRTIADIEVFIARAARDLKAEVK